MLEHTFVHLPSIGPATERSLWDQGLVTWADALDARASPRGISDARWHLCCSLLEDSLHSLERGDHRPFVEMLSGAEHWRAWHDFRGRVGYLDIETTGCHRADDVTVVGLYDGERTRNFVRDHDLDQFPDAVRRFAVLVTFNGASFDLPFLRGEFPGLRFNQLHVDLMHVLRRLGLTGGLKAIEAATGIEREGDVAGLDGWDAVRLWREYRRGRRRSLDLLVRYNSADIENLETLAEMAYGRLRAELRLPCDGGEGSD